MIPIFSQWVSRARNHHVIAKRALEHLPSGVVATDNELTICFANPRARELLGTSAQELLGQSVLDFVHPDDHALVQRELAKCTAAPDLTVTLAARIISRVNTVVHVDVTSGRHFTDAGEQGLLMVITDISKHSNDSSAIGDDGVDATIVDDRGSIGAVGTGHGSNAIDALRKSEEAYRDVLEDAPDAIVTAHADGTMLVVNTNFCKLSGYERDELLGRMYWEVYRADERPLGTPAREPLPRGAVALTQRQLRCKDGTVIPVEVNVRHLPNGRYQEILRDLRVRERRELRSRQSEKFEALGLLTSGIGHDFNNLLTVIQANIELAAASVVEGSTAYEALEDAVTAVKSASTLSKKLLKSSRTTNVVPVPICLRDVAEDALRLARRLLPETVVVSLVCDDHVPRALADPQAVEECILNIVSNARDAMPDGGALLIAIGEAEDDRALSVTQEWTVPNGHVSVAISDTGHGMDQAHVHRAFEPYFTSKSPERGTGLGLAMVYGLMKQQGGMARLTSAPGKGTTVTLTFPVAS